MKQWKNKESQGVPKNPWKWFVRIAKNTKQLLRISEHPQEFPKHDSWKFRKFPNSWKWNRTIKKRQRIPKNLKKSIPQNYTKFKKRMFQSFIVKNLWESGGNARYLTGKALKIAKRELKEKQAINKIAVVIATHFQEGMIRSESIKHLQRNWTTKLGKKIARIWQMVMRLKRDSLFVGKREREREREEGKGRDQHGLIPKCIKKWLSWMSLAWLWFPVELSKNKRNIELVVVVVDNVRPAKILSRKTHWEIQRGPIRWEVAKPRSIPVPNWRFEKPATKTQRNILFCNPHRSFIFLNKKKQTFFFSDTFQTKWTKEKWDVNQPPRTNKKKHSLTLSKRCYCIWQHT